MLNTPSSNKGTASYCTVQEKLDSISDHVAVFHKTFTRKESVTQVKSLTNPQDATKKLVELLSRKNIKGQILTWIKNMTLDDKLKSTSIIDPLWIHILLRMKRGYERNQNCKFFLLPDYPDNSTNKTIESSDSTNKTVKSSDIMPSICFRISKGFLARLPSQKVAEEILLSNLKVGEYVWTENKEKGKKKALVLDEDFLEKFELFVAVAEELSWGGFLESEPPYSQDSWLETDWIKSLGYYSVAAFVLNKIELSIWNAWRKEFGNVSLSKGRFHGKRLTGPKGIKQVSASSQELSVLIEKRKKVGEWIQTNSGVLQKKFLKLSAFQIAKGLAQNVVRNQSVLREFLEETSNISGRSWNSCYSFFLAESLEEFQRISKRNGLKPSSIPFIGGLAALQQLLLFINTKFGLSSHKSSKDSSNDAKSFDSIDSLLNSEHPGLFISDKLVGRFQNDLNQLWIKTMERYNDAELLRVWENVENKNGKQKSFSLDSKKQKKGKLRNEDNLLKLENQITQPESKTVVSESTTEGTLEAVKKKKKNKNKKSKHKDVSLQKEEVIREETEDIVVCSHDKEEKKENKGNLDNENITDIFVDTSQKPLEDLDFGTWITVKKNTREKKSIQLRDKKRREKKSETMSKSGNRGTQLVKNNQGKCEGKGDKIKSESEAPLKETETKQIHTLNSSKIELVLEKEEKSIPKNPWKVPQRPQSMELNLPVLIPQIPNHNVPGPSNASNSICGLPPKSPPSSLRHRRNSDEYGRPELRPFEWLPEINFNSEVDPFSTPNFGYFPYPMGSGLNPFMRPFGNYGLGANQLPQIHPNAVESPWNNFHESFGFQGTTGPEIPSIRPLDESSELQESGTYGWSQSERVSPIIGGRGNSLGSEDSSWAKREAEIRMVVDEIVASGPFSSSYPGLGFSAPHFGESNLGSPSSSEGFFGVGSRDNAITEGESELIPLGLREISVPGNSNLEGMSGEGSHTEVNTPNSSEGSFKHPPPILVRSHQPHRKNLPIKSRSGITSPGKWDFGSGPSGKVTVTWKRPSSPILRYSAPREAPPPPPPPSPVAGVSRELVFAQVRSGSSSPRRWAYKFLGERSGVKGLARGGYQWPSATSEVPGWSRSLPRGSTFIASSGVMDGHTDEKKVVEISEELLFQVEGSMTNSQRKIGKEIEMFAEMVLEEMDARKPFQLAAITKVTRALQVLWPRSRTVIFGSNATGLALPTSDVDMLVYLPPVRNLEPIKEAGILEGRNGIKETCLQHAARYLADQDWVKIDSIKTVENTIVPIIILVVHVQTEGQDESLTQGKQSQRKEFIQPEEPLKSLNKAENSKEKKLNVSDKGSLWGNEKEVRLDISFEGPCHTGMRTAELVRELKASYPCLTPLALVLKQFLADRSLDHPFTGGLSSYCLVLLIARFFQHQQQLGKNVQSTENLGVLLLGFLQFYGQVFDPRRMCVSIQGGGMFVERDRNQSIDPLHVEDPLDVSNNVGRNCFRILQCTKAFTEAFVTLQKQELDSGKEAAEKSYDFHFLRQILPVIKEC